MSEFKDKNYRVTSLAELGPNLPVLPKNSDGNYIKDRSFGFVEWDMELEEKIAEEQTEQVYVKAGADVLKQTLAVLPTFFGKKTTPTYPTTMYPTTTASTGMGTGTIMLLLLLGVGVVIGGVVLLGD